MISSPRTSDSLPAGNRVPVQAHAPSERTNTGTSVVVALLFLLLFSFPEHSAGQQAGVSLSSNRKR